MTHPFKARMDEAIAKMQERIDSCHERVACPKCAAPAGARCCRMPAGYSLPHIRKETKHPHDERLRADGIFLR